MGSIFDIITGGTKKRPSKKRKLFTKARKPLKKYIPLYGPKVTLAGTPQTKKQKKIRIMERRRSQKKTKKALKRIWRRLI